MHGRANIVAVEKTIHITQIEFVYLQP